MEFVKELLRQVLKIRAVDEQLIETVYNNGKGEGIERNVSAPNYKFTLTALPSSKGGVHVGLIVDEWFFRDYRVGSEETVVRICDNFVGRCAAAYNYVKPPHGYAHWGAAIDYRRRKEKDFTRNVYWLNFYSPELVSRIGRERLLSVPNRFQNCSIDELVDGGILLRVGKTPSEASDELTDRVKEYLYGK